MQHASDRCLLLGLLETLFHGKGSVFALPYLTFRVLGCGIVRDDPVQLKPPTKRGCCQRKKQMVSEKKKANKRYRKINQVGETSKNT